MISLCKKSSPWSQGRITEGENGDVRSLSIQRENGAMVQKYSEKATSISKETKPQKKGVSQLERL